MQIITHHTLNDYVNIGIGTGSKQVVCRVENEHGKSSLLLNHLSVDNNKQRKHNKEAKRKE